MKLICSKCERKLDKDLFSKKENKRGRSHTCKECHNKYCRTEWYPKNAARHRAAARKWKNENRLRVIATRYKVDTSVIEELFAKSDGHCDICKKEKRLNVDHCHETGRIRGLLCTSCNTAIGKLKDDVKILQRAIDYITRG